MTCESALEMLLDAEPSELAASSPTALGVHLRDCRRCRRVAAQLLDDTKGLARAMDTAVPVRRPARRALQVSFAPAIVVAAVVFAVVLRARPVETPSAAVSGVSGGSGAQRLERPAPPAPAVAIAVPNVKPGQAHNGVSRPAPRRAFARAVPMAPVRLESTSVPAAQHSVETSGVTVTPPPGTRATVMHTSNPKLLVVWLH